MEKLISIDREKIVLFGKEIPVSKIKEIEVSSYDEITPSVSYGPSITVITDDKVYYGYFSNSYGLDMGCEEYDICNYSECEDDFEDCYGDDGCYEVEDECSDKCFSGGFKDFKKAVNLFKRYVKKEMKREEIG